MTLPLEPHGLKCSKMHLSLFVAELLACSLALVAFSIIEVPIIIIDRNMTPLSCLSQEDLSAMPNRALE
jgi:hypothetical protein